MKIIQHIWNWASKEWASTGTSSQVWCTSYSSSRFILNKQTNKQASKLTHQEKKKPKCIIVFSTSTAVGVQWEAAIQSQWNTTCFYRHSGRLFDNTRHGQQSLVCPSPAQAPSPTNSTRIWAECTNSRDQAPPNPCAPKRTQVFHAIRRQLPGLVFQGCKQSTWTYITNFTYSVPKLMYCWSQVHGTAPTKWRIWGGKTKPKQSPWIPSIPWQILPLFGILN